MFIYFYILKFSLYFVLEIWNEFDHSYLGYAIANTNNNKQNSSSIHIFFPSDSLIKKTNTLKN